MALFGKYRGRTLGGLIVVGGLSIALGGCADGTPAVGDEADLEAGKQTYITSCGSCHALEDAGTTTQIGPNLDDAFRGARQHGFKESQFAGVVKRWIEEPQPPMAADIVTGVDAENVAAYVAAVAGQTMDSSIRPEAPFTIRPPVPGGTPVAQPPPVLQEGEKIAGGEARDLPGVAPENKAVPEGEGG